MYIYIYVWYHLPYNPMLDHQLQPYQLYVTDHDKLPGTARRSRPAVARADLENHEGKPLRAG